MAVALGALSGALGCSDSQTGTGAAAGGSAANAGGSASGGLGSGATGTTPGSGGTSGASGSGGSGNVGPVLALPIEVLGDGSPDAPVVATTALSVESGDLGAVTRLYVRCHRCGFYGSPEFEALSKPLTQVKASLRVLGGGADAPWVDVTDATVELDAVAKAHGGINGGLVTTGFWLTLDEETRGRLVAAPSVNTIEFRFNGTDGDSNGFRVLGLRFEDDAGSDLSPVTQQWADISAEKTAGAALTELAALGQTLWYAQDILIKSPIVPRAIRAACSSCHASDGRDLQYFNYSDHSIVQRSRFHGLSEEQGQQIAAYLRVSLTAVPDVKAAAPWNPPYQPGAGLDARPIVEWAAGAGLDAALAGGAQFLKAMAGQTVDAEPLAVTQAEIDALMDPAKTLNTREMPVPLQFPDWNAWLPNVHPLDLWPPAEGETEGLFETTGDEGNNPLKVVARAREFLVTNANPNGVYGDWSHLTADQRQQISSWLGDIGGKALQFGGGGRGTRQSGNPDSPFNIEHAGATLAALASAETTAQGDPNAFSLPAFIERADVGLYHWMAIQQWELAHTFGLEGDQTYFKGKKDEDGNWVGEGEARGWPYSWPSVFYLAPHMLYAPEETDQGKREFYFSWEPRLDSYFRTNQWYQLQMTVNPGWSGASNGPMDWPYHLGFTTAVVEDLLQAGGPPEIAAAHLARFFQVRIKLAQLANTDIPFNEPDPVEPDNLFKNRGLQSKADLLFKLAPTGVLHWGAADNQQTNFRHLDALLPGLHLMFVNGSIAMYNAFFAGHEPSEYRRCDPNAFFGSDPEPNSGFRFCVDMARTPLPVDGDGKPYRPWSWTDWTTEQYLSWGILASEQLGAEATRLQAWEDWRDAIWPE
jgi:hypothetical protein